MLQNYKEILKKNQKRVLSLAEDVLSAYELAYQALKESDIEKATKARDMLKDSHDKNSKIDNEIIKTLALFSPEARDLRVVIAYLKIASELTRITDYIRSFAKRVKIQISSDLELGSLRDDVYAFADSAYKSLSASISAIKTDSEDELENLYRKVNVEESKCDDILSLIEKKLVEQICVVPENASEFISFLNGLRRLERISDRSVNIVKLAYFAQKGGKLKL